MKVSVKLARSGMNMEEGTICKWHRLAGESFKQGDILYEIETEKATEEVEATADGVLLEVSVREGENARVGQQICVVNLTSPIQR